MKPGGLERERIGRETRQSIRVQLSRISVTDSAAVIFVASSMPCLTFYFLAHRPQYFDSAKVLRVNISSGLC